MITISIDVTQLDKARFKAVTRRNGAKAQFCDLVLIETPNSEHGDYIVKQDTTKEERAAKVEMPILGNGKIRGGSSSRPQGEHSSRPPAGRVAQRPQKPADDEDDIAF